MPMPLPTLPVNLDKIESVALRRIIEEVRAGETQPSRYNRVYHRHNR